MLVLHESPQATLSGDFLMSRLDVQSEFLSEKTVPKLIALVDEQHKQVEKEVKKGFTTTHTLGVSTCLLVYLFYKPRLH